MCWVIGYSKFNCKCFELKWKSGEIGMVTGDEVPGGPASVTDWVTGCHRNEAPGVPGSRCVWPIFRVAQREPD
eukprot:6492607-Amphidinium_carterae.1